MELVLNGPVTERQERMLRRAVAFFLDKLMSKRLQKSLYIEMDIIKNLEKETGNCGTATWEERMFVLRILLSKQIGTVKKVLRRHWKPLPMN